MPGPQPSTTTILSQTSILTDAQFRALPSSPVELVPAQGPGKIIRWLGASLVLDNSAGAYNPIDVGSFLQLAYLAELPIETSGFVKIASAVTAAGVHSSPIPALASYDGAEGYLYWSPTDTGAAIQNVGLGIGDIYNGVPDYTGGNPANTLTVNVIYTVVDA